MLDETIVHILGGGIGGTMGAVFTSPLELIKVRLQSSLGAAPKGSYFSNVAPLHPSPNLSSTQFSPLRHPSSVRIRIFKAMKLSFFTHSSASSHSRMPGTLTKNVPSAPNLCLGLVLKSKIIRCILEVGQTEGYRALFKGLIPTLVGVLPSRSVYFCAYHEGQNFFQRFFPDGHSAVFMLAAACGSITASTLTNPIWYVKTRLQLDSRPYFSAGTVVSVIRSTWRKYGVRGFYRGISASYVGSLETALNFVLYENVKGALLFWGQRNRLAETGGEDWDAVCRCEDDGGVGGTNAELQQFRGTQGGSKLNSNSDMLLCMCASAFSKIVAISAAYPHEVVRTRLREQNSKYRTFMGTLLTVLREEGWHGLYRGLGTHYVRQVPNTCIMIGTYEWVVYLLHSCNLVSPRGSANESSCSE